MKAPELKQSKKQYITLSVNLLKQNKSPNNTLLKNTVGVTKTICVNGAAYLAAPFFILLRYAMRQFVDFQLI